MKEMQTKKHRFQKSHQTRESFPISENIIFGRNSVRELIKSGKAIDKLYIQSGEMEGSIKQIVFDAKEKKIPFITVEKNKLDSMTGNASHQGIVAFVPEREYATVEDILNLAKERGEPPFIILCDEVEDPHNLGAIIRTAECCGAHGIIIPKRHSCGLTSTVSKSSAGAIEHMLIAKVTNLAMTIDDLKEKGVWIYAADMDGKPYWEESLTGSVAIVLGNEGFGVSRLIKEKCDFILSIPLCGKVNSLNVSNAAAILMAETAKQRITK